MRAGFDKILAYLWITREETLSVLLVNVIKFFQVQIIDSVELTFKFLVAPGCNSKKLANNPTHPITNINRA